MKASLRSMFGLGGGLTLMAMTVLVPSASSVAAVSRLLEEPFFTDAEQQVCAKMSLASCGVDFDEMASKMCDSGESASSSSANSTSSGKIIRILSYDTGDMDLMGRKHAAKLYKEKTGTEVLFELVPDFLGTFDEIRSQLEGKLPLYDGFICGPSIVGTAVQLDGFYDLTEYVRDQTDLKWLDVLRGFRENIAVYDNHVRMFPLDGDAHFMFYREDVLEAFNLKVPRTWDEYAQVAKEVHGKEFKGKELVGSCVGIKKGDHLAYWTSLVLSSYTQTNGATQGFIMDAKDLTPLMGEAMAETLKMLELQAVYGHPDVFESCGGSADCAINVKAMNAGICALTYNWGDSFKASHAADSEVVDSFRVAPSPGTTKVLNRQTMKLEPCTEKNCGGPGGIYYEDIGWVNRASYLAFGGWSGAVNNNIEESQRELILDFFTFMNGPEISTEAAIPNATTATIIPNGVDPFRTSHLDVDKWVAKGFTRTAAESYKSAVETTLNHPNAAFDMRFTGADRIFSAMEEEAYAYLEQAVLLNTLSEDEDLRQISRMEAAMIMETRFRDIVAEESAKAETLVPLLEQYQRDLGIFKEESGNSQATALAIAIPIVAAVVIIAALVVYCQVKSGKNDSVWKVKKEELIFPDPQQIVGTGTFGVVLLAEYRGTNVAVKRVIPANLKKGGSQTAGTASLGKKSTNSFESAGSDQPGADQKLGTASWGGINLSGNYAGTGSGDASNAGGKKTALGGKSTVSSKKFHRQLKDDFIKEMRCVSKLRHPCICTVMGAVIAPNEDPMLIMEYMDHGSLYDILHNKSIPLEGEILLPMLCDITQGCRFLHAANPQVIHGDLKSANILVDSRFRAKVADFGLSQKQQLGVTGTPFWMAPELLRQETPNSAASDVYSFGIILYETFSRKDPYEGEDAREVLKQVADPNINKRPPVPAACPPQLAAIMSDCLLANPDERPSFEELDKRMRRVDVESADQSVMKSGAFNTRDKTTVSLFDIFPKHVAEALRDGKKVEAEHKDMVTLFFSDIVGFTTISSTLEPRKVANMLDRLYLKLDKLSDEYEVFKVETIGDAYMAVTNLVKDQHEDHATRIAEFAVSAIKAANETLIDLDDPSRGRVNIRVGFHSGPVVADVVGSRSPRYCLFGDTVNTASRMESNSKENCIHCSKQSADLLIEQKCRFPLINRGVIEVKGKGKMTTFWVDGGAATSEKAPATMPEQAAPAPTSSPAAAPLMASIGDLSC